LISFRGQNFQALNNNRAYNVGMEASATRSFGVTSMRLSAAHLDAVEARTGRRLLRRPKKHADAEITIAYAEESTVAPAVGYASAPRDCGGKLGSYVLADLNLNQSLNANWSLDFRVGNLFERDYRLARGFNMPTREYLLDLHWQSAS